MKALQNPSLQIVFGGILMVLLVATLAIPFLKSRKPDRDYTELSQRIYSWWGMAAVFMAALLFNRNVSIAFFGLISFLAFKEYLSMIPTRKTDRRILFWAYLAIPVQYLWAGMDRFGFFLVTIPVYAFLLLPMRMVVTGNTRGFLNAVGTIHWGLMLTVFSLSHIAYLLVLDPTGIAPAGGAGLVLYLVVLTQANDVAQYLWGKTFGAHSVAPLVSPGKTVEGLLGATVTIILLAMALAPLLTPLTLFETLVSALMINILGFVGDITVSALKRDLGVKDAGSLLPGHGGILDRIDSLTYTAPLFFHFIRYLHFT